MLVEPRCNESNVADFVGEDFIVEELNALGDRRLVGEQLHALVAQLVGRAMGVSEQAFYRWKKQYGGLAVNELRRMKQLEEENRRLKSWSPISRSAS